MRSSNYFLISREGAPFLYVSAKIVHGHESSIVRPQAPLVITVLTLIQFRQIGILHVFFYMSVGR
jgi:hypothetical protein